MYSFLLVFAAVIWGGGFVAQTSGGEAIGSWSFNGIRYLIAAGALMLLLPLFRRAGLSHPPKEAKDRKRLLKAGIMCGTALFVSSSLQQFGIDLGDSTGKAGFLTACYIVLVPIVGNFIGRKCGWNVWAGALISLGGLYMLCMSTSLTLTLSDILLLLCALSYSWQILSIDHYSTVDSICLSCLQFLTVGVLSIPFVLICDVVPDASGWLSSFAKDGAIISLLYAALFSGCLAYTLQIVGQRRLHPAVASLLMSLEAVFSALFGWMILGQQLSPRELGGCGLIFAAVILAQLPLSRKGSTPA